MAGIHILVDLPQDRFISTLLGFLRVILLGSVMRLGRRTSAEQGCGAFLLPDATFARVLLGVLYLL